MDQHTFQFTYEMYPSIDALAEADANLLRLAIQNTKNAYAPYSHFQVGAMALMANGKMVSGTNQENASYPIGICAERVLLSAASSLYPEVAIESIAISYHNAKGKSDRPITPCGICRQSLVEYEARFKHPIRLILAGEEGRVMVIPKADRLLPFGFSAEDMK
ncbi:MAG: cytidine deaminase [Bacteroidota bacterium]|nr:cytidine deaminase [Bacteroidota bacterium]